MSRRLVTEGDLRRCREKRTYDRVAAFIAVEALALKFPSERFNPYLCALGYHWHVGHERGSPRLTPEARAAALAEHARKKAEREKQERRERRSTLLHPDDVERFGAELVSACGRS